MKEKRYDRVFLASGIILVAVIIWAAGWLDLNSVKVEELEITNDAADRFTTLTIELRNDDQREITKLRARINDVDLPYTFNVSADNPILPSRAAEFHRYTAWYLPGGGFEGYVPRDGQRYKLTLTIGFSDGAVETLTKYERFNERNIGSMRTIGGFEMLFYEDADLLTSQDGSSLSIWLRNEWYTGDSQRVNRLRLLVDEEEVWDESIGIRFSEYYAVTVYTPTMFEAGRYHDVTLVAYSNEGNTSTYTRSILCQEK